MKFQKVLITAVLSIICMPVSAETREVFICELQDGRTIADILTLRDTYIKVASEAKLDVPDAYLWQPFKTGNSDIDFLWINSHENAKTFANFTDTLRSSSAFAEVLKEFGNTATCSSALGDRIVVHKGDEFRTSDDSTLVSFVACNLRGTTRLSDLWPTWREMGVILGELDDFKDHAMYLTIPTHSSSESSDLYFYGIYDTTTTWAKMQTPFRASQAAMELVSQMDTFLDCNSSLWFEQRVVAESTK